MVRSKILAFQVPWKPSFGRHALGELTRPWALGRVGQALAAGMCHQRAVSTGRFHMFTASADTADTGKRVCGAFTDAGGFMLGKFAAVENSKCDACVVARQSLLWLQGT